MKVMDFVRDWGAVVGCISTTIALLTLLWKNTRTKILEENGEKKELEEHESRLEKIERQFSEYIERDDAFKQYVTDHFNAQMDVDKKVLANIIEQTYYRNKDTKQLDAYELRRIAGAFEIYTSREVNGNSYIKEIYQEMMEWERI